MKGTFAASILLAMAIQVAIAQGSKERVQVYSPALAGNLIGDSPSRDVTVYLPPSYHQQKNKRYPVVYMLHGFTDSDSLWFGWEPHWINLHAVLDTTLANGQTKEVIVVMPNAYNSFKGSMYSSSATIGDWETFVTQELVSYIDSNYRTLAYAKSRGLAGHSMGGYGTIRLGMKYAEVYAAIYLLSPCCMDGTVRENEAFAQQVKAVDSKEKIQSASFGVVAMLASAAAWAPNPGLPPLYIDVPYDSLGVDQRVASKFAANRILYMVDQYIFNLRSLKGIGMDAGTEDRGIHAATKKLHEALETYEIPHQYESYEGDHLNRIAERIQTRVMPFFSEYLEFE